MGDILRTLRTCLGREEREISTPEAADVRAAIPDRPGDSYSETGMSPEELLCALIRDEGGWTWQQRIVAETNWSESTVSRYLSRLEGDGQIVRVAVGRHNVVGFPEKLTKQSLLDSSVGERRSDRCEES